ncbi:MAG: hypothetical protein LBQ84_07420 [Flavobacteriaceae bacterium]|jgi:hypothetical protein|nr:hypothetical protein [Flavobacteriaceae bacterium]
MKKQLSMRIIFILCIIASLSSCGKDEGSNKESQWISFEDIPLQNLIDGSYVLNATASSGLSVTFTHDGNNIISIEGNQVKFLSTGTVNITAHQGGNETFHEAPTVTRKLVIKEKDPNKLDQTISFELVSEQKVSEAEILELEATASSGLPVRFTSSNEKVGIISGSTLLLQHSFTGETYDAVIQITASQEGNDIYNPADNVVRNIHVIGDVIH